MAENTNIEWADHTFNPWEGCTKVGPGCDHCYAETRNKRFKGDNWGAGAPRRRTSEANWRKPLKWNKEAEEKGIRYKVFCASLADVFDNEVSHMWRHDLFNLIEKTPNLDWLLLTKRIGVVTDMLTCIRRDKLPRNVWLGATIVNQEEADRDIPKLLKIPVEVRFLSMEPLLGQVYLGDYFFEDCPNLDESTRCPETGSLICCHDCEDTGFSEELGIHWVIVGGESGPHARPMQPDWVRSLRDQCKAAGVPFLFKQWGEYAPNWYNDDAGNMIEGSEWIDKFGKKKAGRTLNGETHTEFPPEAMEA